LIRAVAGFQQIEWACVETAGFEQIPGRDTGREHALHREQTKRRVLSVGQSRQAAMREVNTGEHVLAAAPGRGGAADVVENTGIDRSAVSYSEQGQNSLLRAIEREFRRSRGIGSLLGENGSGTEHQTALGQVHHRMQRAQAGTLAPFLA